MEEVSPYSEDVVFLVQLVVITIYSSQAGGGGGGLLELPPSDDIMTCKPTQVYAQEYSWKLTRIETMMVGFDCALGMLSHFIQGSHNSKQLAVKTKLKDTWITVYQDIVKIFQ